MGNPPTYSNQLGYLTSEAGITGQKWLVVSKCFKHDLLIPQP
jgi:hypothetical protein